MTSAHDELMIYKSLIRTPSNFGMFLVSPKVTLTASAELRLLMPRTRSFADRCTSTNQHKGKGKKSRTLSNHQIHSHTVLTAKNPFKTNLKGPNFQYSKLPMASAALTEKQQFHFTSKSSNHCHQKGTKTTTVQACKLSRRSIHSSVIPLNFFVIRTCAREFRVHSRRRTSS